MENSRKITKEVLLPIRWEKGSNGFRIHSIIKSLVLWASCKSRYVEARYIWLCRNESEKELKSQNTDLYSDDFVKMNVQHRTSNVQCRMKTKNQYRNISVSSSF